MAEETQRDSCSKLLIPNAHTATEQPIFVKATWFPTHFHLAVTDGLTAWHCHPSEEEVKQRAAQWDLPVSEYLNLSERYLGHQQSGSVYAFDDAGDGHKRLSWTFEKEGMTLLWRWKCLLSPDSKKSNVEILDFLMGSNINLSGKVVGENELFEKMKVEAEKCLTQSERIANERLEFESEIYAKDDPSRLFVGVLNSKKSKLRELRDKLSKQEHTEKYPQEEDTDKTESFDEDSDFDRSDEDPQKDVTSSSKDVMANKFVCFSGKSQSKSSWPELVGVDGKVAEATIERENPSVNAYIVPEGSAVILDFRCKSSWPELVGVEGKVAVAIIERENPLVDAATVIKGSFVTADFRCDRVRVWVTEDGTVYQVPRIG
ncbi:unnamed protein product [Sphenostylis stenocarpa]|uniref:XRCC4 N-terminal domain-containing protein n=1 Tax=Sphenostylis stenocarpa TaxID=92480 RepID=A0AA87BBE7_9FABA|nr:unnamed protein product [Sphenostylis stenocarpa]